MNEFGFSLLIISGAFLGLGIMSHLDGKKNVAITFLVAGFFTLLFGILFLLS